MISLLSCLLAIVFAQPPRAGTGGAEAVPPEVILEDIRAAYTAKPFGEEVRVAVKDKGSGDRADRFVLRVDPGAGPAPARILLTMGSLSVCVTGTDLIAVSSTAPGLYYSATLPGPPTPQTLAKVLPPIPVPGLAFACREQELQRDLTPYTTGVSWSSATAGIATVHPQKSVLQGSSHAGPITLEVAPSGRLLHMSASVKTSDPEAKLELDFSSIDPGDPAKWAISTEGRRQVKSLAELRPAANSRLLAVGDEVPNLQFVRADRSTWNLWVTSGERGSQGAVLVLYRFLVSDDKRASALADARVGLVAAVAGRMVQRHPDPDVAASDFPTIAAAVIPDSSPPDLVAMDKERSAWAVGNKVCPELMLGVSQMIDRFDPKAAAMLVLIGADKKLIKTIPLDARASDLAALTDEIRKALAPKP